jgi:ribonuclease P protein component
MKVRENRLPHSRFGIVVGIKVHKRAVKRNLVRRRISEILRLHLPKIKKGYDVMVLVQPKSVGIDYAELETQVLSCLKKLNLLA